MISSLFDQESVEAILRIPIPIQGREDEAVWTQEKR